MLNLRTLGLSTRSLVKKSTTASSTCIKIAVRSLHHRPKSSPMNPPVAKKVPHPVYFGVNPNDPSENRGENPMNPPISVNDDYYWLRDDDRKNPEVLEYVQQENAYFVDQMKDTEEVQKGLYTELLSHLKETDEELPGQQRRGGWWYYTRTVQGLAYKMHCRRPANAFCPSSLKLLQEGDVGAEQVYLDENELAEAEKARYAAAKAKAKAEQVANQDADAAKATEGGLEGEEEEEVKGGSGSYTDVGSVCPSHSEALLAYSVDHSGSEQYTIRFRRIDGTGAPVCERAGAAAEDGEAEVDVLSNTCGSVVWGRGDAVVYYLLLDDEHRPHKLMEHTLGTAQSADRCLYTEEDALFWLGISESTSGDFVFLGSESKETTEMHCVRTAGAGAGTGAGAAEGGELVPIRARQQGVRYSVDHYRRTGTDRQGTEQGQGQGEDVFFIVTNIDGSLEGKLMCAPCSAPAQWSPVLPYAPTRHIEDVNCFQNSIVLAGREGGLTALWVAAAEDVLAAMQTGDSSASWHKLTFSEASYSCWLGRNEVYETDSLRVEYTSLVTPRQTLAYDMTDRGAGYRVLKQKEVPLYDASLYRTERTAAPSRDGQTMVPITMVYRKEVASMPSWGTDDSATSAGSAASAVPPAPPRRPRPMLLTGYGSYGCASDPMFDYKRIALLDRGVTVAIAHIRGGNEMGRYWYEKEGKYLTKRNTFLDFIDSAKFLTEESEAGRYATKEQLAIVGRSAGGLLVGAAVTMAPEQFRVAVADVPFVDSLITMADPTIPLTVVEWEEWGNPNEVKFHDYMASYAPYQGVKGGVNYPALLVTTGLNDPRVAYWEGAKFVAKMRAHYAEAQAGGDGRNILLLKTDMSTGHFSASDRYKFLKEMSSEYAFILKHLGMLA